MTMTDYSNYKNRSRKIAREAYWDKHDRQNYECPDCGRREDEISGSFEVHHISGNPLDNRPANHVALCRLCHNLREGKKPAIESIERLRDEQNQVKAPDFEDAMPNYNISIPIEAYYFVNDEVVKAHDSGHVENLATWWSRFQSWDFPTEQDISRLDILIALQHLTDADVTYNEEHQMWDIVGVRFK
jgi:hypothetical protein